MFDRDILESERITDRAFAEASEDIKVAMNKNDFSSVVEKCQEMPSSKQKFAILSYAYMGLKEWKNLIDSCDKGIEVDNEEPEFYCLKAKALGKLGKNHERILLLEKAIELNNSNPSYHRNLGSAYYAIQRYQLAIEEFNKAIEIEPDNVMNYHNKGSAHLKNEEINLAKESFEKAVNLNPNLALSYSWLADCEILLEKYEEAKNLYKKAYDLSGKEIYLKQIEIVEKEKELNSNKGSLLYGLSWIKNKIF